MGNVTAWHLPGCWRTSSALNYVHSCCLFCKVLHCSDRCLISKVTKKDFLKKYALHTWVPPWAPALLRCALPIENKSARSCPVRMLQPCMCTYVLFHHQWTLDLTVAPSPGSDMRGDPLILPHHACNQHTLRPHSAKVINESPLDRRPPPL